MLNVDRPADITPSIQLNDALRPAPAPASRAVLPAEQALTWLRKYWPWLLLALLVLYVATHKRERSS